MADLEVKVEITEAEVDALHTAKSGASPGASSTVKQWLARQEELDEQSTPVPSARASDEESLHGGHSHLQAQKV